jgi:hypothetical protein
VDRDGSASHRQNLSVDNSPRRIAIHLTFSTL